MSTLIYKDIQGSTEFDQDSNIFFGKLIGINGVVMYEGESAEEFKQNFMSAVDEYIDICKQNEIPIKKEFKGVFNVRTTPDIHEALNAICVGRNIKMNAVVNEALELYIDRDKIPEFKFGSMRRATRLKAHNMLSDCKIIETNFVKTPANIWTYSGNDGLFYKVEPSDFSEPKDSVK